MEFVSRRMGSQEVVSIRVTLRSFLSASSAYLFGPSALGLFQRRGPQRYAEDRREGRPPLVPRPLPVPLVRFCRLYRVRG